MIPYPARHALAALLALTLTAHGLNAAEAEDAPAPAVRLADILGDEVVCKGRGFEIRRSALDRATQQFKANAIARGQTVPTTREAEIEALILDRLVVTRMLMARATDTDRTKAKALADKFIAETRQQAGSAAAFERQLLSMGFTEADFGAQILERTTCEEVVERELRPQVKLTDADVRAYYDANTERLKRPEMLRVRHILLSTLDGVTGRPVDEPTRREKYTQATQLLARARKGEEMAALAREFSEDPASRANGGETMFSRGQMVAEFELAAAGLQTNQISDIVTSRFGYHIIQLIQRIPAELLKFDKVAAEIRESLERREVQEKRLPVLLKQLRQEAALEYLNGARPPPEAATAETPTPEPPAPKATPAAP